MFLFAKRNGPNIDSQVWNISAAFMATDFKQISKASLWNDFPIIRWFHYNDVIMTTMASQITSLTVVYSTVYSVADQRKHQSSASLAFVWGIHRDRWIPRTKRPVTRKKFLFDDVIMWIKTNGWLISDYYFIKTNVQSPTIPFQEVPVNSGKSLRILL